MSELGATKFCVICKVDLTGKPRTRDKHGKYFCAACYDKALAAKHERQARERHGQNNAATHSASHSGLELALPPTDEASGDLLDALTAPPPTPQPHKKHDPRQCPQCEHTMPVGAVLCTFCGHNLSSGNTLEVNLPGVAVPGAPPRRVRAPQRTSTTVFAVICGMLGAVGFYINMLAMGGSDTIESILPMLNKRSDFSAIVSLLCNVGLLATGVLLYMRNATAKVATQVTFALAMLGAVWAAASAVMHPSDPDADIFGGTMTIAGIIVRVLIIAIVAWFFWLILRHLRDPATRVEFGTR